MKSNFYKNISISLFILVIAIIYLFFDFYLTQEQTNTLFKGYNTFIKFTYAVFFGITLGVNLLIARVFLLVRNSDYKIFDNFFYTFSGIINIIIAVIWSVLLGVKLLPIGKIFTSFPIGNYTIAAFFVVDIFINKEKPKSMMRKKINIRKKSMN